MKTNQEPLLTYMPLLVLATALMIVFMALYDRYGSVGQAGVFGLLGALSLGTLSWHMRGLKERRKHEIRGKGPGFHSFIPSWAPAPETVSNPSGACRLGCSIAVRCR